MINISAIFLIHPQVPQKKSWMFFWHINFHHLPGPGWRSFVPRVFAANAEPFGEHRRNVQPNLTHLLLISIVLFEFQHHNNPGNPRKSNPSIPPFCDSKQKEILQCRRCLPRSFQDPIGRLRPYPERSAEAETRHRHGTWSHKRFVCSKLDLECTVWCVYTIYIYIYIYMCR